VAANHLHNRSEARGAGVFATGAVTVESSSFSDNVIDDRDAQRFRVQCALGICAPPADASVRGGAIRSDVSITATRSTFAGNRAEGGMLDAPVAPFNGDVRGGALSAPDVRLDNVTLDANASVQYRATTPATSTSTILHEPGAAAAIDAAAAHLSGVTLTGSSGAAAIGATTVDVRASAIGGTERARPECAPGTVVASGGANRFDDDSCGSAGAGDAVVGDLALLPLSEYGGPTRTRLPAHDSPVIDAVPAGHPACTGTDQRGVARPVGPACDAGAVEAQPVDLGSDLSVFADEPSITLSAGGGARAFVVTVRNSGPRPAPAELHVSVPPGLVVDPAPIQPGGAGCREALDGMVCAFGEIPPGGTRIALIPVRASVSGAVSPSTIGLTVVTMGADPDPTDNHAEVTAQVVTQSDLAVSARGNPDEPGTLELLVRNRDAPVIVSPSPAVRLQVQLAPGVSFVGQRETEPAVCSAVGSVITCTIGPLAVGDEATVNLELAASGPVPADIATATILDADGIDPDPTNNVATVRAADLAVTASRPAPPVPAGQDLPVEVVVTNKGAATATDIIWDAGGSLTSDQVVASEADSGFVSTFPGYQWRIPSLAPGASARLRLTLRTPGDADVLHSWVGSSAVDFAPEDNRATIDVRPAPEGYADLTFDPPTVRPLGESQHVQVVLRNTGPAPMTVAAEHPLVFVASDPRVGPVLVTTPTPGWTCDGQQCRGDQSLPAGATVVFDVLAGMAGKPVERLRLQVRGGATAESGLADNERWAEIRAAGPALPA
jgi:hypothetical protein